ncbi:DUF3955 domain-containing protein [Campylobacter hyointestinalis]|uniref:DUF3955 domain-containing protein n=1 Tax=Campylobacter hyointestinalis subsp. hyointestinalis TaxID=91352 RepID=A0A0S4RJA8_CAMHY|nr:DUF3955 domain-containing protein [Campylobacter hyointestinalis]ANE32347.1 hypothetical membrane protein [Campylobacter hyointestinalis subsp. hyointestinalis LMG 9260]KEA44294.1 hypothetical protein CR67_05570 [Campylobacter hyointestinalis subsp. hyointestinalis]MBT0612455.1 DUF3955 domain-containing protein [Campylobacter hyointestinalis subsp. hyointestinalis]MDL2346559.1 DUF3955 domain-containing protein [Campylobacter hyointestinalis]MDL2348830.1 DUF3955 domain-containing protein [Ca
MSNKIILAICASSVCIGLFCICLKAFTNEWIDTNGVLHEYFFLLPIGFFFIIFGIFLSVILLLKMIITAFKNR